MKSANRVVGVITVSFLLIVLAPLMHDVAVGQTGKVPVALEDFESQNSGSARWDFLRKVNGPSDDPISNGLMERLTHALDQTNSLAVVEQKTFRGPKVPGFPPDTISPPGSTIALDTPRFIVSCSATMNGDLVTIEVRLIDPQTKRLIKATTVEGRPEDLQQEIGGILGTRQGVSTIGHESVAEQTLRTAIAKAATWIGANTLESVIVKAVTMKVKEGPSLQSATLATVRQGTVLTKVGQDGEWIRVRLESGDMGWVYRELVE
jgi:TolB-like protein